MGRKILMDSGGYEGKEVVPKRGRREREDMQR